MTCLKRTIMSVLLTLLLLPLWAQQQEDTTYLFRFVPGKDMFYVPWGGNQSVLDTLLSALSAEMEPLRRGERYISVTSYAPAATENNHAARARMGYLRCQRVKSELIAQGKVTEAMFVTDRCIAEPYTTPAGERLRNVVVVVFPAGVEKVKKIAGMAAAAKVEAYNREVSGEAARERLAARSRADAERQAEERARQLAREQDTQAEQERAAREAEAARLAAEAEEAARQQTLTPAKPYTLALRANLLRWATLTPDLGVEWRIGPGWSVLFNGSWTSWSWDNKNRRYALWEVAPEVRYYIGMEKRGYVGAMFRTGEFNYKFSATGRQGDLTGGGITGGYRLKLNRVLALDFSLGIGCLHANYDKYEVTGGVKVRQGKESRNWWGPVSAGVTLMWNLF